MGTATFLFTDIEGSTALLQRLGADDYGQVLASHHALIRYALAAHGGQEVDTQGDAFFAVFDSPVACGAAALEMQQKLAAHDWPGGGHVKVRMGIHTGEATRTTAGWVGLDVHRAARIAAVAHGGQVVLSESAAGLARDNLPTAATLTDLGMHKLKDLGHPVRIYQLDPAGVRAEFPRLRSLDNPALLHNLPAELTPFIGRQRELGAVLALVEQSRLVTLTGAGGAGKTRLALQVAADLLDGSGDGVWMVELAPLSGEEAVTGAICEALRIQIATGRPALEALADALAPQEILIMLDNCEHLIGACAKVTDALLRRCPKVHIIATSREPLGIAGEMIYRVPSMSMPASEELGSLESFDAVALFAVRARAQGVDLSLDGAAGQLAASVCRRLDGLPLAVELAAARLRSMSLQELHERLNQRFRLLTGGSRTALARQQTLRAAIGWSYALLNPAEQTLLRRLPVFVDSFDLTAAEAVCGFGDLEALDVAELLGSLVDKSLVVAEQAGVALRYRLLETIRQYAAERQTDEGEREATAAADAHCMHYLGSAEAAAQHLAGPDQVTWIFRLDVDYPNIRSAMAYAAQTPETTDQALRFGVALHRYVTVRTQHEEAILRLLFPVLGRLEARRDYKLLVAALIAAGYTAPLIDMPTTRRLGHEALQVARELNEDRLIIESLTLLTSIYRYSGESELASSFGRESVGRARQLGDDVLLADSICAYLDVSEPDDWSALFAEAIASAKRSGDLFTYSALHNQASYRAAKVSDIRASRTHLDEALRVTRAFGQDQAILAANTGLVLREEGSLDSARSALEAGLSMYRRNGDYSGVATAVLGLACVASDKGDRELSAQLHGVSQTMQDRAGVPWNEVMARYRQESLAHIRGHMGDEQADHAYAVGAALSFADAMDLAFGRITTA